MPTVIPSYQDNITIIAPTLLRNSGNITDVKLVRGIIDLRLSYAAILFAVMARGNQSAIRTNGVTLQVRRTITVGASQIIHPNHINKTSSLNNSINTIITSGIAGLYQFSINNNPGFVPGDTLALYTSATSLSNFEIVNVLRIDGTTVYIDSPLQFGHTGDIAYNSADVLPPFQITGGAVYEVIFDCMQEVAVCDYVVRCMAQIYNGDIPTS
jgi:hypothetical protein